MKKPRKKSNPSNPKPSGKKSGSHSITKGKQGGKTPSKGKGQKTTAKKPAAAAQKGVRPSKRTDPMTDGLGKKFDYASSMSRLVAVHQCLLAASLRGGVVTMKQLRELAGITRRTIHRYKRTLSLAPYFVSVAYDRFKEGYFIENAKPGGYLNIGPGLTHHHKLALEVASQALAVFDGVKFADQVRESLENISNGVVETERLGMAVPTSKLISFRTPGAGIADAAVFDAITETLLYNRVLVIDYKSRSKPVKTKRLDLEPLHLACVADRWVLVARDRARKPDDHPIRTYIVARFSNPKATNTSFTYPKVFEPEHYVQSAFGVHSGPSEAKPIMVKLRISERGAHHVQERMWHPTQQVTTLPTGEIEVDFRVSDTGDITRWILSFGSDCEVLAPAKLRQEITAEAALMIERYQTQPSRPI